VKQPKFEGKCEELKGHIYNCIVSNQANLYTQTMKRIAKYACHASTVLSNICRAILEDLEQTIDPTAEPMPTVTQIQMEMWLGEEV
jgi:hypothetical protein